MQRRFKAGEPRQLVVCDVTAMTLASGEAAYLAMVLDVNARKVVGWDLSTTQDARLTVNALKQAAARGSCEEMLVHAD
ncbi:MAG: DDE-type integrase/transposase/recombinase [Gammaproteobacteria bacterium]|nr:DDE-type integrase/transposase/recombinase [Gammaproteobacteria bacterium]